MTKVLTVFAVFGLGIALGRLLGEAPRKAEAGGGLLPPCQDINGDGSSNLTDAVSFLNWLFLGGPEPTCPPTNNEPAGLPDTGQAVCYGWGENRQRIEVPCNEAACPGQDGSYSTGCASEGRFVDNGDGTVTDNCTRLMWQKDTADVNNDGRVDDRDRLVWCEALVYCDSLLFADHNDWRLPNVRELQSLVDYGQFGSAIDPAFAPVSEAYWSSSTYTGNPEFAWLVDFQDGDVVGSGGDGDLRVRAVRNIP